MAVALLGALIDADGMAAGDVAKLVSDDTLQLIDIVGRGQKPAVDIDDLSLRDEGVDFRIVDQHDPDALSGRARQLRSAGR